MATVAIGAGIPIAIAPAMHDSMYRNPAVAENIERLRSWGISFIGPRRDGVRAKVASKDEVVAWTFKILSRDFFHGKRLLVIGGRSEEPIDSMRIITNRSTGMMAVELAKRAFERGADVELWMGGCSVDLPDYIPTRRFETVSDLVSMGREIDHDAVLGDPVALKRVREAASTAMDAFLAEPTYDNLFAVSNGFSSESGLESPAIRRGIERLKSRGYHAGMCMLGNSLFTDAPEGEVWALFGRGHVRTYRCSSSRKEIVIRRG